MLTVFTIAMLFKWRFKSVATYDAYKRKEQRAMQNRESSEVEGKRVRFCLFVYDSRKAKKAKQEAEAKGKQSPDDTESFYK